MIAVGQRTGAASAWPKLVAAVERKRSGPACGDATRPWLPEATRS